MRNQKDVLLLRACRVCQLTLESSEGKYGEKQYVFQYQDCSHFIYEILLFYSLFFPFLWVYYASSCLPGVLLIHSVQGAYELSVLWVQYTRYNQNPQIKVSVVNIFGEGNGTPLQYSCLANPMDRGAWWAAVHGVATSQTQLSNFTFTFHFHALEKEMATHSSILAWRIPGTGEPGGLPSVGSHRVGHD